MPENNSEPRDGLQSYALIAEAVEEAIKALDKKNTNLAIRYLADITFITSFAIEWLEERRKVAADASK